MDFKEFKQALKEYLIEELDEFAPKVKDVEMRCFDIGIFPCYGDVYFSFLTEEAYQEDVDLIIDATSWDFYDFNYGGSWIVGKWIQTTREEMFKQKELEGGDSEDVNLLFFEICGEVLREADVLERFGQYRLSPRFKLTVYDGLYTLWLPRMTLPLITFDKTGAYHNRYVVFKTELYESATYKIHFKGKVK